MEQEIRPLTRKEQLEWLIPFLEAQIYNLELQLEEAKEELNELDKDEEMGGR